MGSRVGGVVGAGGEKPPATRLAAVEGTLHLNNIKTFLILNPIK